MYHSIYNLCVLISYCYASIALDRFIDKKLVFNKEIKVINENKNYIWIEYHYQFYKSDGYKNATRNMNQVTEQLFTDHYKRDFAYLLQETQNELEME